MTSEHAQQGLKMKKRKSPPRPTFRERSKLAKELYGGHTNPQLWEEKL